MFKKGGNEPAGAQGEEKKDPKSGDSKESDAPPVYKPKKGTYNIQVHVIEARDLKGKGMGGSSDPVCTVECCGSKKQSTIKKKTFNPRWDEVLFFEVKDMEPAQLEAERVRVRVNDARTIMKDVLIGAFDFDLSAVYYARDHELYRCWVALTDVSSKDEGVQGYLKVSIVCLGPDDEQKIHSAAEMDDDEGMVLMAPHIEQKGYLLEATVWDAFDLVQMDTGIVGGKCDPYVLVDYAGVKHQTQVLHGLSVSFNQILQMPVMEPVMSDRIRVFAMDHDVATKDESIGVVNISYKELKKTGRLPPRWYNLYGSPALKSNDIAKKMNDGFLEGSTFRGKFLAEFSVKEQENPKLETAEAGAINPVDLVPNVAYTLQVDLYEVIELPKKGKWVFEVTCGALVFPSKEKGAEEGVVKWNSVITTGGKGDFNLPLLLPADPSQCPDLIFYLSRNEKRISYYRMAFSDVLAKGWHNPPRWLLMKEDKVLDLVPDDQLPGIALVGVRLGRAEETPKTVSSIARPLLAEGGEAPAVELGEFADATGNLKIFVDQAQDLPISDKITQSSDPFVKIIIGKEEFQTRVVKKNLNPQWAEEFLIRNVPFGRTKITLQVWDWDVVGKDLLGESTFSLQSLSRGAPGENFKVSKWIGIGGGNARVFCKFEFKFLSAQEKAVAPVVAAVDVPGATSKGFARRFLGQEEEKIGSEYFGEPTTSSYEIRAYIYQARRLNAADLSGASDPFVEIRCAGKKGQTPVKKNTLNPAWYSTVALSVNLPECRQLASDIHVVVYDADMLGALIYSRELLGRFSLSIEEAMYMNPTLNSAEPKWFDLKDSDGNLVGGSVLASFHVIETSQSVPPKIELRPPTIPMWLEISTLGLRSLQSILPISKAFVEFYLPNGKKYITNASRLPDSNNPNMLQVLKLPVDIPEDAMFAPSLDIIVKDSKFGGVLKTTIGSTYVFLEKYLMEFRGREDDAKRQLEEKDLELIMERQEMERRAMVVSPLQPQFVDVSKFLLEEKRELSAETHEQPGGDEKGLVGQPPVLSSPAEPAFELVPIEFPESRQEGSVDESFRRPLLADQHGEAMVEMTELKADVQVELVQGRNRFESVDGMDIDQKVPEEEKLQKEKAGLGRVDGAFPLEWGSKVQSAEDAPPEYMVGREVVDDELEDRYTIKPFELIEVYTGKEFPRLFEPKRRKVGVMKALIRLSMEENAPGGVNPFEFMAPQDTFIRLYVLKAANLSPMDSNGLSDPYIKVKIAKEKFSSRDRYVKESLNPDIYEQCEFPLPIPGASQLKIEVWDYDGIGDDLIGFTTIDVEDRWFCKTWRDMKLKPAEWRTLKNPTSSVSQGKLLLWVDIFSTAEARVNPIWDIRPPPPDPYEARIIVWNCKDVVNKDTITDMNDLYVTGVLDLPECGRQKTDVHLRAKKGKGSFNWRMKWQFTLPTKVTPRFVVQLWDMDIFSANDAICEGVLNLKQLLRYAHKLKDRVRYMQNGSEKIEIVDLYHPNEKHESQGKCFLSFEVMPASEASQLPAGIGRSEPNTNPALPPPEGRMKLSWLDPLGFIREMIGDGLYYKICCCLICATIIAILVVMAPTILSNIVADSIF